MNEGYFLYFAMNLHKIMTNISRDRLEHAQVYKLRFLQTDALIKDVCLLKQ